MTTDKKPISFAHTYEIQDYDQVRKAKQLLKDGHPVKCHKCGPSIVPNGVGGLVPVYEHCSTHCTRALIGQEGDDMVYIQTCEVQNQKFLIQNAKPQSTLVVEK